MNCSVLIDLTFFLVHIEISGQDGSDVHVPLTMIFHPELTYFVFSVNQKMLAC